MRTNRGFTLIELLLVLGILGVIAAIAIPTMVGARTHARSEGEAKTHVESLRMALETFKADNGRYPTAGTYTWNSANNPQCTPASPVPQFVVSVPASRQMEVILVVNADRLSYTVTARDPLNNRQFVRVNQNGQVV